MRSVILPWVTAVVLSVFAVATPATAGDELEDARVILNAKANTIKKWHYSPRLVVVHDRPVDSGIFENVTQFIHESTGLPMTLPEFVEVSAEALGDRFFTASRYTPRRVDQGRMTTDLLIAGQPDLELSANIFVFMVSPRLASHFITLTAWGRASTSLHRAYVQGNGPCFFSVLSNAQSIHFGTVLISPEITTEYQERCVYEELTQAMGLMNDAQDSTYFTYDNLADNKPRENDRRLLSALYDPSIVNGDEVEKVVELYSLSQ